MKRFGMRRVVRYGGAAGIVALVGIVVAIAASTAGATPSTKVYTTAFTPKFAAAGSTGGAYTLTLTNCGVGTAGCAKASNQTLGSANYAIPAQYVGKISTGTVSSPTGGWTVSLSTDGGTLQFRSATSKDGLMPGQSVTVPLTIDAPAFDPSAAFCTADDWIWDSRVKQSNDFSGTGNDYSRATGTADASLTAAQLVFADVSSPPAEVKLGDTFSAAVTAEDACGHPLLSAASGIPVALSLVDQPGGGGILSGASQPVQTDSSGVATFTGLSIDAVGTLYQLSAAADNFATGTSNHIAIVNVVCEPHKSCSAPNNDTHITATVQTPAAGHVGVGFSNATDYVSGFATGCGSSTPIDGQVILIHPTADAYTGNYSVTVLYDKTVSGTGPASAFSFCISDDGLTWLSPPNPLQACASPAVVPCIKSQKRTVNGALQVVFLLAPGDPYVGGK